MGGKLTIIYRSSKKPFTPIDGNHPPEKQIVRAIASDDGRFATSQTVIRAILYSDMAENSDLGSAYLGASKTVTNYGAKLGSYLRHGVFYGFGLGQDISGNPQFNESARAFWQAALRTMASSAAGIGADLNVPNIVPIKAASYAVEMQFEGQTLTGRLALLVGTDGNLVDSTVTIQRLGSAGVTGTFSCDGENGRCTLSGQTTTGLATSAPNEDVTLEGQGTALTGKIGVHGQDLEFPLKAQLAG